MYKPSEEYHISFFRPTTPQARSNRNMVVWMVSLWFIAIFGFQILLLVLQKPTPEPSYLTFQKVWATVDSESADEVTLQEFGFSVLSVLGKTIQKVEERAILDQALSYTVYHLAADSLKEKVVEEIATFEQLKAGIDNISDPSYVAEKERLSDQFGLLLELEKSDVRRVILPVELTSENITGLTEETRAKLPGIMEKYLVHNQSVLTDTKVLGFPFHYFYTAVFLLILFVGLCWLYCVRTDRINKKLNIAD
ncbi:MAG: DUF4212 domain-containing protein [Bacteroidota bacterium]